MPVSDQFQDCCKNWSFNSGFCFMVIKICYGYYSIQSSNHQKLIEEKRLSKCDVMMFIKHLCILNSKVFKVLMVEILKVSKV